MGALWACEMTTVFVPRNPRWETAPKFSIFKSL